MREFPAWNRPGVEWPDVVRPTQLRRLASDVGAGGGAVMRAIPSRAVGLAQLARSRCVRLPGAIVDELRRRVNPLELATKQDVEVQSKLGRNRVSFVLNEFLEGQRSHDEELLALIRAELREELESFAAALNDDVLAIDPGGKRRAGDVGDADDDWILSTDDEAIDLVDDDVSNRRWASYEAGEQPSKP
jgi:hypothetical protein